LGSSYALLFGVADANQAQSVFARQHITPAGIPCGWPNLPRYESEDGNAFGRHMGTVWPQIQGFWAEAAARSGRAKLFGHELFNLAKHARRDRQFAEIYHPLTGEIYGGMQESRGSGIVRWRATSRQTWAATAYLRMILLGLAGMRFNTDGVRLEPCVPDDISLVELRNISYRHMNLNITIHGSGTKLKACAIDGHDTDVPRLSVSDSGKKHVVVTMEHK
jgi:glycogen debranching enzyme